MARIRFALKDNKIVSIDEVERGLACGCVCIHCHAKLKARKGDEREHHFAHHDAFETMDCYEYTYRAVTKEALVRMGEINLPINEINKDHIVVQKEFIFKYSSVEFIDGNKNSSNGLEILVELKNESGNTLDVLICTGDNENKTFRENISRIRVNLPNVQVFTFEEFCDLLACDLSSKEWIYNKKAEAKVNKDVSIGRTSEENIKLGKAIWEKKFKGKR